jgi:hypothetical protein
MVIVVVLCCNPNSQAVVKRYPLFTAFVYLLVFIAEISLFMQVDATKRGGLARFINHSCEVSGCVCARVVRGGVGWG